VVAAGAVEQLDGHELGVVKAVALELCDPLRPGHAHHQRLKAALARAVLLVHRKQRQVHGAVAAVALGPEERQRGAEVRHPEPSLRRRPQVAERGPQIVALVGEVLLQALQRDLDRLQVTGGRRPLRGVAQRPVGGLQQRQRVGGLAQRQPRLTAGARACRRRGGGRAGGLGQQRSPQLAMTQLAYAVIAEQIGVGRHHHPPAAVLD